MADDKAIYIGKPYPQQHVFEWKEPQRPSNPALRGIALHLGATILSHSTLLQSIFWSNAGFHQLRDRKEWEHQVPRYDPTVIKTDGSEKTRPSSTEANGELLSEDWTAKLLPSSSRVHRSIIDYHTAYLSGNVTPTAVIEALLPLIRKDLDKPTSHATAFMSSRADLALLAAAASTERYRAGKPLSPLDGVPIAVKDHCDVTGYPTSFSSKIDFTKKDDTTSYEIALLQAAGAVLVGKTVMHEFGNDITNNNPFFGTPRNPYHGGYYTGGSSGGSAYAVAAGLMPFAQGNDAGGSIRIPSAFCGVYGLKTSHDRISNRPAPNITTSVSVSGPIAANMVDLEIAYRIMAQPDMLDPKASLFPQPRAIPPLAQQDPTTKTKTKLGIYKPWFDRADPLVREACLSCISYLTTHHNYERVDITLPLLPEAQLAHAITFLSEQAAAIPISRTADLTPANKILLSLARHHTAADLLQAQKVRHLVMQHLSHLFTVAHSDAPLIIVTPTTPQAGWEIHPSDLSYGLSDANMQLRMMEYVFLANFSGCPALTAPCGYAKVEKNAMGEGEHMPIGIVGMAEWCGEDTLLEFGYACEKFLEVEGGGRRKPRTWVDGLEMGRSGSK